MSERVVFNGITYYRYPDTGVKDGRKYFRDRRGAMLHRAVYSYHYGEIPSGHDIHHVDGNTTNNDPSNLRCLTASEHRSLTVLEREKREFTCSVCGSLFQSTNWSTGNRYCGPRCINKAGHASRKMVESTCVGCGCSMEKANPRIKHCSRSCAIRHRRTHV